MTGFLSGVSNIFAAYLDLLKALPNIITRLRWFLAGLWLMIRRGFRRPPCSRSWVVGRNSSLAA
jgi:hypothetical protein